MREDGPESILEPGRREDRQGVAGHWRAAGTGGDWPWRGRLGRRRAQSCRGGSVSFSLSAGFFLSASLVLDGAGEVVDGVLRSVPNHSLLPLVGDLEGSLPGFAHSLELYFVSPTDKECER